MDIIIFSVYPEESSMFWYVLFLFEESRIYF